MVDWIGSKVYVMGKTAIDAERGLGLETRAGYRNKPQNGLITNT